MDRRSLIAAGAAMGLAGVGAGLYGLRTRGAMADYNSAMAARRILLEIPPETRDLIRYATLAPSGHNTQPWRFRPGLRHIDILPDLSRRTPVVDPDDHHLFVGLGCAAETLAIAACARGRPGDVTFEADGEGSIRFAFGGDARSDPGLFEAIPKRQSTRADFDGRSVSAGDLRALSRAANVPGVDLVMITDRAGINRVRDLVIAGNTKQMSDPAFLRELKAWMRFSPELALTTGDGLFSACSGRPIVPDWLGRQVFDHAFNPTSENDKYARSLDSSPGVAVFVAQQPDKSHWVQAGRACQRFALQATALGLKHAFINQPVETPGLWPDLANLAGVPGRRPDLVMRFGYGPTLPYSARRAPSQTVMA
jgi:hypothetical protein